MTVGNVLGLVQQNVKRTLAYSSIAHTGYMLVALLVGPVLGAGPLRDGAASLLFYIAIYAVMNLGAFAALAAFRVKGREIETFDDLAGLARRFPAIGLGFAVCVFSLMGLPPTAGFVGKLYILSSALSVPEANAMHSALVWLVIIGVANTAIGAAYYLRIIAAAYTGEASSAHEPSGGRGVRIALALCAAPMILLFALPTGLSRRAQDATAVLRTTIRAHDVRVTVAETPKDATPLNSHDAPPNP